MAFRQLAKVVFPTLERDLSHSIGKEVSTMEELMLLAPRVFSYQAKHGASAGAFARTTSRQAPADMKLTKIERPVTSKGLFHE